MTDLRGDFFNGFLTDLRFDFLTDLRGDFFNGLRIDLRFDFLLNPKRFRGGGRGEFGAGG